MSPPDFKEDNFSLYQTQDVRIVQKKKEPFFLKLDDGDVFRAASNPNLAIFSVTLGQAAIRYNVKCIDISTKHARSNDSGNADCQCFQSRHLVRHLR